MNRHLLAPTVPPRSVPRMRGDEPLANLKKIIIDPRSPHARG